MTPDEIMKAAEARRRKQKDLADDPIGMSNYRSIVAAYQDLLNDAFVMIRELARNQAGEKPKEDSEP